MFLKKHQFPINIFLIIEKSKPIVYTSKSLDRNHYICVINNTYYDILINLFKNEVFLNYSFFIESSIIDKKQYKNVKLFKENFKKTNLLHYSIFYNYLLKIRISIFQKNKKINSINQKFNNSTWCERENNEMYNMKYLNLIDSRSLLLDYSKNDYPMLKDFPTEGYEEIFFDFFENKVNYINNEFIEL